jgi:hypothetical protein
VKQSTSGAVLRVLEAPLDGARLISDDRISDEYTSDGHPSLRRYLSTALFAELLEESKTQIADPVQVT